MNSKLRAMVLLLCMVVIQLPMGGMAHAADQVSIDIRPGEASPAQLNMRGTDMSSRDGAPVSVAILSTSGFDASGVDVSTLCFGDPNNATQRDCSESHGRGHFEDVDRDGDTDLLLHYDLGATGLDDDDTSGCLEGRIQLGAPIYGCDGVLVKNGTAEAEFPNLAVSLVAVPSAANAGDAVEWTATVTNDGIGAVTLAPGQTLLSLDAPSSLSSVAVMGPADYDCSSAGSGITGCSAADPDTILVGGTRTFTLDGILPTAPGPVTVGATVDPSAVVTELNESDNTVEAAALVQTPNLTMALVPEPGAVAPGDDVSWTATLGNDGAGSAPVPAGAPLVRFSVPAGLSGISFAAPSGFTCTAATSDSYDCVSPAATTVGSSAELDFTLSAMAPASAGVAEVTATADPNDVVAETSNVDNQASAQVFIEDPNLIVALAMSPAEPNAGDAVQWTATVTNIGPTRVRLGSDAVLLDLTYAPDLPGAAMTAPTGYACSGGGGTFACSATAADTLGVGDQRVFQFDAAVPATGGNVQVTATVDPDDLVGEADETDNSATSSTDVVVPLPDLTVSLTSSPDPVDALGSLTWTATITNVGSATELPESMRVLRFNVPEGMLNLAVNTPSGYSCFISAPNVVDCATSVATPLAAGGVIQIHLLGLVPRTPGALPITATVDPLTVLAESDETNNSATDSVTVQPPDFSITINGSPDPVDALASVTYNTVITNDGPANARLFSGTRVVRWNIPTGMLNLAVNTPSGYSCFIAAPQVVDCSTTGTVNIPAGGTVPIDLLGLAPRDPGALSVTATADPLEVIPEGDETDNSATDAVTVQPPDFSVTVSGSPDPVDALHSVTYSTVITNDGPANARLFSGTRVIRFNVPAGMLNLAVNTPSGYSCFISAPNVVDCALSATVNIPAGGTVTIDLLGLAPREPGPLSVTAIADPLGAVPEGDETDNSTTESVTVQPPDFSITTAATPDPVDALHAVTWETTITNDGPAVARIFSGNVMLRFEIPSGLLNLAVNAPAGYSCFIAAPQVVHCQTTATMSIPVGGTVDIDLLGLAPREPGQIEVTAIADPLGAIPEVDETDNSATDPVTVRPPDFSTTLVGSPDPVAQGGSTTWTATITNDGPAAARLFTNTRLVRFEVPSGLTNLAVNTPAGYSCFISAPQTVDCATGSTTTIASGDSVVITLLGNAPSTSGSLSVTATADPLGTIPEGDETDNAATATINVS